MIYLVTDSVGCAREEVTAADTYPVLLKRRWPEMVIKAYYSLSIGMAIDWLTGMAIGDDDKVIMQCGVVDCVTNGVKASVLRGFLETSEVARKLFNRMYVVGIIYYGPECLEVERYNTMLAEMYGNRYVDIRTIENSHTIEDGIHLNKAGHIEMVRILQEVL